VTTTDSAARDKTTSAEPRKYSLKKKCPMPGKIKPDINAAFDDFFIQAL
jgi:hypothetical protein